MNEYKLQISNGKVYAQQFDVCRKLTAHAKLDNIRQAVLWIEEMENYDEVCSMDNKSNNNSDDRTIGCYSYNSGYIVPR